MSMECGNLLIGNSMAVYLIGLKVENTAVNDATCGVVVKNSLGDIISGDDPISMPYTGTAGKYRGVLPANLDLEEDATYTIVATAEKGGVGVGRWTATRLAKQRDAQNCC